MSSLDVRAIEEGELKKEKAPAVKTEFRVFLAEEAFDRAVERGGGDTTREIGGVLVGEVYKDDAGPYLKIETTVDALHADEKGAELTFTHDTWDHINKEMDTKHKGKKVVGWYHTHPGFGVFLSDRDQFIQKSFFNLPFQVAFVYDPKSKEHGMFTWHDNEIRRARRYWVGSREQLWDGARVNTQPEKKDVERKADEKSSSGAPAEPLLGEGPGMIATMIIIGLILLLIGGFLGRMWGMSGAQELVDHEKALLAQAKAEGAQQQLTLLQTDLVGILRATMGDEALRKPIVAAVNDLEAAMKSLDEGQGSGAADPRIAAAKQTLMQLHDSLIRLANDRLSAEAALGQLEEYSKRNSMIREDLSHDVSMQRVAVGQLYAELAGDVAKTDKNRAKRLLSTAAQVDPGNADRYEAQLHTFDPNAKLPHPDIPAPPADQPAPSPSPAPSPAAPAGAATGSGATASASGTGSAGAVK